MDKQRLFKWFVHVNAKLNVLFLFFLFLFSACDVDENEESGSLFLKLSSDFSITAVTKAESKALTEGPSVNDFKVAVYQGESGTSLFKTWNSFADMASEVYLPQNTYVLKASYGEQHKGAFEMPYYEGTAPFSIIKRKSTNVSVVCKIANTKVTLEYADGFKNYFKDWSAKIASTGDSLTFTKDEVRGAYFEPGQVGMNLTMTRQDGKTITYAPPTVATEGGKHYRFRLDVTTGGAGGVNLVIKFDKTTEEKPIYVDISGDNPVIVSPPYISATGFSSGMPITVTEGTSVGKIYTLVNARGKIKSCVLRTESRSLTDEGWPASVDLADASANVSALKDRGIVFTAGMKGAQMAEIDFTNLIPTLKASSQTTLQHTFTLEVTDEVGKKNEEFTLVAQMAVPGFRLLNLDGVDTSDGTALIRFEMTSGDVNKIEVEAKSDYGIWNVQSWTKKPKLTNTANVYEGEISIDFKEKQQIRLNYNKGNRISNAEYLYRGSFKLEMFDGKDANPDTNPYIWATKARVKIKDNTVSASNLQFRFADVYGEAEKEPIEAEVLSDGSVWLKGLEPGVNNKIIAYLNDGSKRYSQPFFIKTEDALQFPNSGFENWDVENTISNLTLGGKSVWAGLFNGTWYYEPADKINFISRKPQGWTTTNKKTAAAFSSNLNSWYVVPTVTNLKNTSVACVRNVAWDYNGEVVKDNTDAQRAVSVDRGAKRGTPVVPNIRQKSIGRMFLGDYSCTHDNVTGGIVNEEYKEGLNFNCRPTLIEANYIYKPVGEDKAVINVQLKDKNDNLVGKCILHLQNQGNDYKTLSGKIEYLQNEKVQKICIMIAASNSLDESKINIKTNSDYNSNNQIKNKDFYENALTCTGSELYLDDLKLIYE